MTESIEQLEERLSKLFGRINLQPTLTQGFVRAIERTVNSHRAYMGWSLVEVCSTPEQLRAGVMKFKLKS